MKRFIFVLTFVLPALALSQTSPNANQELQEAFQREYAFLASQKNSLETQARNVKARAVEKSRQAEQDIKRKERELIEIQAQNDSVFSSIQNLEKNKKEELGRENTLKLLWKRVQSRDSETPESPQNLSLQNITGAAMNRLADLQKAQRIHQEETAYLTKEGILENGRVLKIGQVAAFAIDNSEARLLAPDEKTGELTEVEKVKKESLQAKLTPIYIFDALQKKIQIKKPAGWMEAVADTSPLIFLALLFGLVGALFLRLARI